MSRLSSLVQRRTENSYLQICNIFADNPSNPECPKCSMHSRADFCIQAFPRYFIKDILECASL